MTCVGAKPAAPRTAPKPRLVSGRKPAGRSGGLGVKKMSKQVDESLFDQKPEEQAPPAPVVVSPCPPPPLPNTPIAKAVSAPCRSRSYAPVKSVDWLPPDPVSPQHLEHVLLDVPS